MEIEFLFSGLYRRCSHMIIEIDAETSFNKIQYPFKTKTFKVGTEGNFSNLIKDIYQTLTADIILVMKN